MPEENLNYVGKTLQLIRQQLPADKCLIGFGGAPFTLASYLFKKKNAADFSSIKKFCFKEPESFFLLMKKLEQLTIDYLQYQIDSGAEIIQIFDSWAGCFHLDNYRRFVLPSVKKIVCELKKKIYNTYYLLSQWRQSFNRGYARIKSRCNEYRSQNRTHTDSRFYPTKCQKSAATSAA